MRMLRRVCRGWEALFVAREISKWKICGPVFFLMGAVGGGSSDWWFGVEDSVDSILSS